MFRFKPFNLLRSNYSTILNKKPLSNKWRKVSKYTLILLSTGYASCYIKEYIIPTELSIILPINKYHNNTKEILQLFNNYQLSDLFNNYITLTVCNNLNNTIINYLSNLLFTLQSIHLSWISNYFIKIKQVKVHYY